MAVSSAATSPPIAILDEHGDIVGVNQAWKAFGNQNGLPERYTSVGKNYIAISQQAGDRYGYRVATELHRLLTGEQTEFTVVYPCHAPNQERWFRLYATTVSFGDDIHYLLVHQRLDQNPSSRGESPTEVVDAPTRSVDHGDRSRLVTYSLSSAESAIDGVLRAFEAIGIDLQSQDTTLQDWTDPDIINELRTTTSDFHITFFVWDYPVGLTPEKVIIFTPEPCSE